METLSHTVLCVDDEPNILNSLRRLLRGEGYRLLTSEHPTEALDLLAQNDVHVLISDHRMPELSGTEFMAQVKERYPDVIRILLTGYTDVDTIAESVNKGQIFKFFLKPWNDQHLKMEIHKAIEQYDMLLANRRLQQQVIDKNRQLQLVNENLEEMVAQRTQELELQNQALELWRTIMETMPIAVLGVSAEGLIVVANRHAQALPFNNGRGLIGVGMGEYFNDTVREAADHVLNSQLPRRIGGFCLAGQCFDLELVPMAGLFKNKGIVVMILAAAGSNGSQNDHEEHEGHEENNTG